jgi:pimeloyl-ACP methyl ester carboxylesterase
MHLEILRRSPPTSSAQPPILCIHGAYHAAWCWEEHFLPYFAQHGYDAIAPSLRGHGGSDGRERIFQWRLTDYLDDVLRVADELGRPPILLGHSMGCTLALMYLERRPAAAAVLLAPAAVGAMRRSTLEWFVKHPRVTLAALLTRDMRRLLPTFRPYFFSAGTPREQIDRYMARMQEESFHVVRDHASLAPPAARSGTPILLLHGQADAIPLRRHQALARRYGAALDTFPLGHELMLEADWRHVADRILGWLAERGM